MGVVRDLVRLLFAEVQADQEIYFVADSPRSRTRDRDDHVRRNICCRCKYSIGSGQKYCIGSIFDIELSLGWPTRDDRIIIDPFREAYRTDCSVWIHDADM